MKNRRPSWKQLAVSLDQKVKDLLTNDLSLVPGVVKVIDYSNFEKKTATPKPGSDIDLIIIVNDKVSLSTFKDTLSYYLSRYSSIFRHTPWVIPESLWEEYINARPYDTPRLTKFMTTNKVPSEVLFFSCYELLLDSFFSAMYEMTTRKNEYYLSKYIYRTQQNLLDCVNHFYYSDEIKKKLRHTYSSLPLESMPFSSLLTLKKGCEEISLDLAKQCGFSIPREQIHAHLGWASTLFFISPPFVTKLAAYVPPTNLLALRILNSALLAYSYALTQQADPPKVNTALQKEFLRRKRLGTKWMSFRQKTSLESLSFTPYGYRLLTGSIIRF